MVGSEACLRCCMEYWKLVVCLVILKEYRFLLQYSIESMRGSGMEGKNNALIPTVPIFTQLTCSLVHMTMFGRMRTFTGTVNGHWS